MPIWAQHFLVLSAVAAAALVVVRQAIATLRAGKGGFGSCCAKGCSAHVPPHPKDASAKPAERVAFVPVESLTRRRK
jgi:hypothetical protein